MAWLPGYAYRKPLPLTGGASGAQTDFQLNIDIAHVAAKMQADFDDIRFTQNDGTTLIDAWLESKVDSTSAETWVEFPATPANTVESDPFYMYYGKGDALDYWDGTATFLQYHGAAAAQFIDSLSVTPSNIVYEGRCKVTNDIHDIRFGLSNLQDFSADDSILVSSATPGNLRYAAARNESAVSYKYETPKFATDTYYRLKAIITDSAFTGFVDDDQVGTGDITTNLPNENLGLGMHFHTGTGAQEWSFVRKYAASPPTYAFGAEESVPTVGAIMNQFQKCNIGADLYNGAIIA